eukprot:scaffold29963_cov37-Attheya_sp.AAC.1
MKEEPVMYRSIMGRIGWHQFWTLLTSNDWLWWGVMAAAAVGSSVGVAYCNPFHNTNATNTTNTTTNNNKEENDTTGKEDTVGLSSFGVVSAWGRRIIHPKRRDWVASWMAIRQSSLHEEYARMLPLLVAWWCGTQTQPHYPTSHHGMGFSHWLFVPSTVLFATWLVSPTNETTNTDTTTTTIDHDPNNATTPKNEKETEVPMKVQEEEEEEGPPPSTSTSVKEDPIRMTRNDLESSSLHNNNKEQENGRYLELLVHNVSHTDLVLSLASYGAIITATSPSNNSET